jgi:hypothetical protein
MKPSKSDPKTNGLSLLNDAKMSTAEKLQWLKKYESSLPAWYKDSPLMVNYDAEREVMRAEIRAECIGALAKLLLERQKVVPVLLKAKQAAEAECAKCREAMAKAFKELTRCQYELMGRECLYDRQEGELRSRLASVAPGFLDGLDVQIEDAMRQVEDMTRRPLNQPANAKGNDALRESPKVSAWVDGLQKSAQALLDGRREINWLRSEALSTDDLIAEADRVAREAIANADPMVHYRRELPKFEAEKQRLVNNAPSGCILREP